MPRYGERATFRHPSDPVGRRWVLAYENLLPATGQVVLGLGQGFTTNLRPTVENLNANQGRIEISASIYTEDGIIAQQTLNSLGSRARMTCVKESATLTLEFPTNPSTTQGFPGAIVWTGGATGRLIGGATDTDFTDGVCEFEAVPRRAYESPTLWVGSADTSGAALGIDTEGNSVGVDEAMLNARYTRGEFVGRRCVFRGENWTVTNVQYPDRRRTMRFELQRTIRGIEGPDQSATS